MKQNKDMSNSTKEEFIETLRPSNFENYIGQESLKKALKIFISAAKQRDETIDHILLYGPHGLGKTSLAYVIANEMGGKIILASGPSFERIGDLAATLSKIEAGDILFIDEIHRMPKFIQETLYSVMEDFVFNIMINKDYESKSIVLQLPPFTLVCATTNAGYLSSPFRSRFGYTYRMHLYTIDELSKIVKRTSEILKCKIDENACLEIAKRSRGTPRLANQIFKRVRDYAQFMNSTIIDKEIALSALKILNIDEIGLDEVDIRYLTTLIKRFNGGPVGLETLAFAIGEEVSNLQDIYEPYLIQIGFIDKTTKGRIATLKAYKHLGIHKNSGLK